MPHILLVLLIWKVSGHSTTEWEWIKKYHHPKKGKNLYIEFHGQETKSKWSFRIAFTEGQFHGSSRQRCATGWSGCERQYGRVEGATTDHIPLNRLSMEVSALPVPSGSSRTYVGKHLTLASAFVFLSRPRLISTNSCWQTRRYCSSVGIRSEHRSSI